MINLQKYYNPTDVYILVVKGKVYPTCLYFNHANNISKQYDYRIVKKIFNIDCSMYDVFFTPSLKDFVYQNFGDQVGFLQK